MKRAALVAGVSLAALLTGGSPKVQAAQKPETWWANSRAISGPYLPARKSFKERSRAAEKADSKSGRADGKSPIPSGPLHIIVSIDKQRARLFADGRPVASTPICTAPAGHPTPMGVITFFQKAPPHV